jgi:hypothetical protein
MHIQEAHLAVEHIFCMIIERSYFDLKQFATIGTNAATEAYP